MLVVDDVLLVKGLRMKLLSASQLVNGDRSIVIKGNVLTLLDPAGPYTVPGILAGEAARPRLVMTRTL